MNTNLVTIQGGKARLSNHELHRRASKSIREANQIVFEAMPSIIAQIIENKVWEDFQHENFATYALDATSNGLGVNTNQRLWILRCALDLREERTADGTTIPGRHIAEWAEVLSEVERMVRIEAAKDGRTIRGLSKTGLESLAKNVSDPGHSKITYLPSRQSEADGHLIRIRKRHPEVFQRVISREITLIQARKDAGMRVSHDADLARAKSTFNKMTEEERAQFIEWLRENFNYFD